MRVAFAKMHGAGNDFVVVDATTTPFSPDQATIRSLADRRRGIGFDQLLIIDAGTGTEPSAGYRIFNADGEEVEQCGNGVRCIASLLFERLSTSDLVLASPAGPVHARVLADGEVSVDMGVPDFTPAALSFEASTEAYIYEIDAAGSRLEIGAVSIGNPHAVLTVPDVTSAPVDRIGPALEHHPRFGRGTNVGFMQIVDSGHVRLRVHERGTGETQACGTGACAAVAVIPSR